MRDPWDRSTLHHPSVQWQPYVLLHPCVQWVRSHLSSMQPLSVRLCPLPLSIRSVLWDPLCRSLRFLLPDLRDRLDPTDLCALSDRSDPWSRPPPQ